MIKDLKIIRPQKIGLAFIFSFALVCVALDIVRTVEAVAQHQALYTIIEINLVVIISCLPIYRTLLNIFERTKSTRPPKTSAWTSLEDGTTGRNGSRGSYPLRSVDKTVSKSGANAIHVTNDVTVSNTERDPYCLDPLEAPGYHARPQAISKGQALAFT